MEVAMMENISVTMIPAWNKHTNSSIQTERRDHKNDRMLMNDKPCGSSEGTTSDPLIADTPPTP